MSNIRVEAEQMALNGYRLESNQIASGGQLISLLTRGRTRNKGTASFEFTGTGGYYQVVLGYFDESDGAGQLSINYPSGTTTFKLDRQLGGRVASEETKVRRTIATKLWVESGDSFTITGNRNRGEFARVDYIDFIPINSSDPANDGKTADYSQTDGGIIANLNKQKVLKPIFGTIEQAKIMAIGDSITDGTYPVDPTPGAYRIQLWNRFISDSLNVDFVGSKSNGPSILGDKHHEGHPGWTINQITTLVDNGLLFTYQPDVVLLMIGTNDILRNDNISTLKTELSQLIDKITTDLPNANLVVSSIAPLEPSIKGTGRANVVKAYNEVIPQLVKEKVAQGQQITYANAGGSLSLDDLVADGIHPNAAGYDKLGNAWYKNLVGRNNLKNVAHIKGTAFQDKLTGNANNNELTGGGGSDTLTGGGGADSFVYENPTQGSDSITDFSWDDEFIISASGFGGGLVAGVDLSETTSSTGTFVSSLTPVSLGNSANFLYETDTGILSFDPDGVGAIARSTLAVLSNLPALNSAQFTIVS